MSLQVLRQSLRPGRPMCRVSLTRSSTLHRRFTTRVANPDNLVQLYISNSHNPFVNLSIEHHLLQKTPAASSVLFLYTNRPCIVIGRNQNPWVEVNMSQLAALSSGKDGVTPLVYGDEQGDFPVHLVRRRSGGGAVFHDFGNINFSVIAPSEGFDRDRHANMVVRALHSLGVNSAQVNCRHDIIVAPEGIELPKAESGACKAGIPGTFKVSGSAYKLTRLRSLHHGTCLLESPNLKRISGLLRSPGRPWIEARGVESVRSPVQNVDLRMAEFEEAVLREWKEMYGETETVRVGDELVGQVESISKGLSELMNTDWVFGQTPRFKLDSKLRKDAAATYTLADGESISFSCAHGKIESLEINQTSVELPTEQKLYEIPNWVDYLASLGLSSDSAGRIGDWTNQVLGSAWINGRFSHNEKL